jgi:hypothetical protein
MSISASQPTVTIGVLVVVLQMFTGPCDWDAIRELKRALSIPVIANGGIGRLSDVIRCLEVAATARDVVHCPVMMCSCPCTCSTRASTEL